MPNNASVSRDTNELRSYPYQQTIGKIPFYLIACINDTDVKKIYIDERYP